VLNPEGEAVTRPLRSQSERRIPEAAASSSVSAASSSAFSARFFFPYAARHALHHAAHPVNRVPCGVNPPAPSDPSAAFFCQHFSQTTNGFMARRPGASATYSSWLRFLYSLRSGVSLCRSGFCLATTPPAAFARPNSDHTRGSRRRRLMSRLSAGRRVRTTVTVYAQKNSPLRPDQLREDF